MEELILLHPAITDVSVKVTEPLVVSVVDGLYVGVNEVKLEKHAGLPQPLDELHEEELALAVEPAKVAVVLFLQSDWSGPATGAGAFVRVRVIVLDTLTQPDEVSESVSTTLPFVLSVGEAV